MSKTTNAKQRPSKLEGVEKKDFLKLVMNVVQIFAFLCKHADKIWSWLKNFADH